MDAFRFAPGRDKINRAKIRKKIHISKEKSYPHPLTLSVFFRTFIGRCGRAYSWGEAHN
jgi:hypothetical protein